MREQLQGVIKQMRESGILYCEGVREFKKLYIGHVLAANRGNQSRAAREMGMHRNTLSRTILELGMAPEPPERRRPMSNAERLENLQRFAQGA